MDKVIRIFKIFRTDNHSYKVLAAKANMLYTQNEWLKQQLTPDQLIAFEKWKKRLEKNEAKCAEDD